MRKSFCSLVLQASKEKTTKRILITALLAGFVAAPAFADDSGVYIAVDLGAGLYGDAKVTGASTRTYDDPGSVGIAGGYRFNPYLGVEAGYSQFGDSTVDFSNATTTLKTSVFQVAAVGTYPFVRWFSVFGKLGLASVSAKESGTGAAASLSGSGTTTNLMLGAGVQFNIRRFGIRLQYEDFGKAKYTPSVFGVAQPGVEIGVRVFSVGGVFNF